MQVKDIQKLLEAEGTWVPWQRKTRDHQLTGDAKQDVHKIGVCWTATLQAIHEAASLGCDMVITHENPFYQSSTQMDTAAYHAAHKKQDILRKHGIAVYRCHDVWDCIRKVGVADSWAKLLGYSFEPRAQESYYQAADIPETTLANLALHTAEVLQDDHEDGVYVFGNPQQCVNRIAIGTGAATNLYDMLELHPDAVIVCDDGITNYDMAQYALDHGIGMVVCNHAAVERAGLKAMIPWLQERLIDIEAVWLEDGFHIHYYKCGETR